MISLQQAHKFILKTPEQRRVTARFLATKWLAKLPYAPHKAHLTIGPSERVTFWWSHFAGGVETEAGSLFVWTGDTAELRLLWRLLQPGMTFFDVGAYHGIYSIIAAKKVGSSGSVIAFEPSPREQHRLRIHLRLNRVATAHVEPCALAAEEGKATLLTVVSGNTMMNSLRPPLIQEPLRPVQVPQTTIDKYLARRGATAVDLIKIDTEGAELEVFRGAEQLLGHLRPLIICEVLDKVTRPWGYPAREIISHLQAYEYQWYDILRDGKLLFHQLQDEYPEVRNYLAVPREKLDCHQ